MAPVGNEAEKARAFARQYVNLVEALLREGVEISVARNEARLTAFLVLAVADKQVSDSYGHCVVCGRG